MQMIADGYRIKEIAEIDWLSDRAIENRRLRREFNCKSITHLTITLLRQNIIT
jgi:DNA-binding CsgD family transcriptional regulator